MTENTTRLRIRSFQDSTMEKRLGNDKACKNWWAWWFRTMKAIKEGVPDASLEEEPST